RWIAGPDNPFFARAFVNRVWTWYFGHSLSDFASTITLANPPRYPELLDALTRDFVENGHDIGRLERLILSSMTYQLSSTPTEHNKHDRTHHSSFQPSGHPARLLLDLVADALDAPLPIDDPLARSRRAIEYRGEKSQFLLDPFAGRDEM